MTNTAHITAAAGRIVGYVGHDRIVAGTHSTDLLDKQIAREMRRTPGINVDELRTAITERAQEMVTPTSIQAGDDDAPRTDYMTEAAQARELHTRDDRLSENDYRLLISAVETAHPVVLVTTRRTGTKLYRETNTVIVTALDISDVLTANRIRIRRWGFAHYVWVQEIVSVDLPATTWVEVTE